MINPKINIKMSKKVILAFSGGLDTSYCAKYLSETLGYEVYAVTVNTGGFSKEEEKNWKKSLQSWGERIQVCRCSGRLLQFLRKVFNFWECLEKQYISIICKC